MIGQLCDKKHEQCLWPKTMVSCSSCQVVFGTIQIDTDSIVVS